MSDEFDKEAEREKLREKFADDAQKREHTQRMSDLLLKGATMTNAHCDRCGDPIFRHDGQEFCPSCNAPGAAAETAEAAAETSEAAAETPEATTGTSGAGAETPGSTAETSSTLPDPGQTDSATGDDGADPARSSPNTGGATVSGAGPADDTVTNADGAAPPAGTSGRHDEGERAAERPPTPAAGGGSVADLDDARASLTRTLTKFARAAEATDDPRRARDHLQAAREAAEALAALE